MSIGKRIYVVKREDGLVKIGVSRDPENRIRTLEMQGGFTSVAQYSSLPYLNAFQIESAIHDQLKEFRAKGEWFAISYEVAIECVVRLCVDMGEIPRDRQPSAAPADQPRTGPCSSLSVREREILSVLGDVLPKLSELEKEKLLAFGEGMAFVKSDPR